MAHSRQPSTSLPSPFGEGTGGEASLITRLFFPFYIARRYLFSKKSTHAINVISAISVIGVAVATMALVIVLSVFNGFHDLVATLFTSFDPQIEVVPVKGKPYRPMTPYSPRYAICPKWMSPQRPWKTKLWPSMATSRRW